MPTKHGCSGDPAARGHRRAQGGKRKERILHTRVSDSLAEDIRRMAEDLRVPASNLVRNVLEEVFDVVESVSGDVGELFEEILDEADVARKRVARARARARRRRAERNREEPAAPPPHPGPPPPPREWHLVEAGRPVGPLGLDELGAAVRAGRLRRETLVWSPGMADWAPAGELEQLADLFRPPAIPAA
jgi:hypothetical protein